MMTINPNASKALIYATWGEHLLVFDEPDFPNVALQVPGGTMEPGEGALDTAFREFFEETGIAGVEEMHALGIDNYVFVRDGTSIVHHRHYFHARLKGPYPRTWVHVEQSPFGGGPPVRFRFFWVTLAEAAAGLGYGMERSLQRLNLKPVGR